MTRVWRRGRTALVGLIGLVITAGLLVVAPTTAVAACSGNAVACENQLAGTPESVWDVDGVGDQSIQGFATSMSVNAGSAISFKVDTNANAYTIKIYRLGYYQNNGAREVTTINPSASLPQNQPACATDATTEIYDCGTWGVSATWNVPSTAVSGVYIARLIRSDTGGDSHIPFVVRNDDNTSDVLFQTSDSTWQAYNMYGGSEFYHGKANGRAYKISYNRPFSTRGTVNGRDFLFSNEYPTIRFLEQNGFDVSYVSGLDVHLDSALVTKHKAFVSSGHDEYWSKEQRKHVTDARDAGVNLLFLGGNDVYWKTRWEPSQDGSNTPNRTLVDYKDTWAGADIDPVEPTATWRDPRFGDLGYGYGPENALIGTQFQANSVDLPLKVDSREGKLRIWRNTSLATMAPGTTASLSDHTVGYESNEDVDNGYRPAGLIQMSTTTGPTPEYLTDYGTTVQPGTTTHHITLYRAMPSGALVFSAGTIQWGWGLDASHDGTATPADPRMRQATVNILADMGAAASTIADDLIASTKSTDTTAPTVVVSAPSAGSTIPQGSMVTVSGSASDSAGQVAGVEVSLDAGATWHPADGTTSWTYSGILNGNGSGAIQVRATDDSARTSSPTNVAVNSPCPCSMFGVSTPTLADANDGSAVSLGVRFTSSQAGYISGIRFYKAAANTGTHTGTLYTSSGTVLATGTFTNESASGWQLLKFANPVAITAGTTYVAAYYAPNGHYSADQRYFATSHNARMLTALGGTGVANGVYADGTGFPSSTYKQTNYYVDAVFSDTDDSPVTVTATSPIAGAASVPTSTSASATFSKDVVSASAVTFTLTEASTGTPIPGATTYSAGTKTATFNPAQVLQPATTYTATVNATGMGTAKQWSFTTVAPDGTTNVCPCTLFNDSDQPAAGPDPDTVSVQLGLAFTVSQPGQVSGVRFFKNVENVGPHKVNLWSGTTKLAEATSTSESSTGWQQVNFDTPISVQTGTTYVVSYTAPQGRYGFTAGGLASKITKGSISSVATGGRYTYGTGAPTSTSTANYFADVVYSPLPGVAPTVRSTSPGNGATSVSVDKQIQATFSVDVQPGSAVVVLKKSADWADQSKPAIPGTTSGESQGPTVTFIPTAALDPATSYTFSVSGARSLSGTAMSSSYTASFTTSGAAACPCSLMETTTQPVQVDSNDGAAVTLGLRFTSTVNGYVKGLRYYRDASNTGTHTGALYTATGTKLAGLTFTDGAAGWQTANFSSAVAVTAGTTYVAAYYAPNGHYSADLNYFAAPVTNTPLRSTDTGSVYFYGDGFPNSTYMNTNYYVDVVFDTNDDTPPAVSATTPAANATAVPTTTSVTATFSKDIDPDTYDITVTDSSGTLVSGQKGYDAASRTATFTTAAALAAGATYTASAKANSASGVAMVAPATWSFTTVDTQPPVVTSTSPADLSTSVPASAKVTATFANSVAAGSVVMTLKAGTTTVGGSTAYDAATRTATFTPTSALANYTSYTASITASNTSGVAMGSAKTWSFKTADTIAPTVTAISPASNATSVPVGTAVTATFSRDIDQNSLSFVLKNSGGTVVPGAVSYNPTTRVATFTPTSALAGVTTFTATVSAQNTSNVAMAQARVWSFTTADVDPPSVTGTSPANGATGVAASANVTATFLRAITTNSLVMSLKVTSTGTTVNGAVSYSSSTRTATFNPTTDLTSSTQYTASVSASNANGVAMSGPYTWTFTTAAQTFSLYTTSQTPSATSTSTTPTTVGVVFSSSRGGQVTAIRYYANSANTGNTVQLRTIGGASLGTATTTQTGTGWRTATFSTPIAITPGTQYVASYYARVGRFSTTTFGYLSSYTSGPLSVPASGARTGSGDVFPTAASSTNHWVDVLVRI